MDTHARPGIVGEDGWHGSILRQMQAQDGTAHVVVALDGGDHVTLPVALLMHQLDGSYYVPLRREALAQAAALGLEDVHVIPVIAEQLLVEKRTVETGRVLVQKVVHEREAIVDEPLLREDVHVERVSINQPIATAPTVRQEGDTLIIPVVEEVLVKQLFLKEELRITRRHATVRDPQTVTLHREEVVVEHLPAQNDLARDTGSDVSKADSPAR